ncbi:MAG: TolC family protein [Bacteroidia bacterium]|nr:TolC family protein [Bacteroidia bacterium]
MQRILCAILFLIFSAVSNFLNAQKVWTLQECVEYALKNNLQVKQGEISSSIAEANKQQSLFSFFPSINGSASYNYNTGRSVDAFTNTFTTRSNQSANFSISSGVTLFNGFQLQHQYRQSRSNLKASGYDLDKVRNDISLNVAAAYLQAVYAKEETKAAEDRLKLADEQLSKTKKLVENDLLAKGSLLEAEAQMATEDYTRITAHNAYQNAILTLTQLMNLESADEFEIEVPSIDLPRQEILSLTSEMIFKDAMNRQPEIKSAAWRTFAAKSGWKGSLGGRLPRLTLFGSISTLYSNQAQRIKGVPLFLGYQPTGSLTTGGDAVLSPSYIYEFEKTPFSDQFDNNLSKSFGFSLSIPVFNGRSTEMSVKRSKLNYENARINQQLVEDQLYKSIQQAHQDAVAALNKLEAAKKSADAQTEALMYMEKKYEAGLVTSLEYNTARNNLTRAQSNMLQSKYDLIFKIKVLDFYAGKPLSY